MTDSIVGSADPQSTSGQVEKSQDSVAYETYRKAVSEAKNAKERLRVLEVEKQALQENKLKEQNEWKTLAEQREIALQEKSSKLESLESTIVRSVKLSAFQRHLGGKIKDDAYFQFVDVENIGYNPDTGKVDDESAKTAAAEFIKRHSSLVEFKSGRMPNEAASNVVISKKVEEMSTEELTKYIKDMHSQGKL